MSAELVREGTSVNGHRVTLKLVHAEYDGAKPYYDVTGASCQRYTPLAERAETLYAAMMAGVTDPEGLKHDRVIAGSRQRSRATPGRASAPRHV